MYKKWEIFLIMTCLLTWLNVSVAILNAMLQLLVIYRLVDHCGIFLGCRYMTGKQLLKLDTIKFIISTNHTIKMRLQLARLVQRESLPWKQGDIFKTKYVYLLHNWLSCFIFLIDQQYLEINRYRIGTQWQNHWGEPWFD